MEHLKEIPSNQQNINEISSTASYKQRIQIILWFRGLGDLRLHDNEMFREVRTIIENSQEIMSNASFEILPIFCFDPRTYNDKTDASYKYGDFNSSRKCGVNRAQFMIDSVQNLRLNLSEIIGANSLLIFHSKPEICIPDFIIKQHDFRKMNEVDNPRICKTFILFQEGICAEEKEIENLLTEKVIEVQQQGIDGEIEIQQFWGSTLWNVDDLAFYNAELYTNFIKDNQSRDVQVREIIETPFINEFQSAKIEFIPSDFRSLFEYMPTLYDFGFQGEYQIHPNSVIQFKGGEKEGLKRMEEYIFQNNSISKYKKERNGFTGQDFSSKLSPWIANGCISVRLVYWKSKEWENLDKQKNNADHFIKHLFVRDFWKFWALHHGDQIFYPYGPLQKSEIKWNKEFKKDQFDEWANGTTGFPIIDATMRDLKCTGYISNRGRQIVASYLTQQLKCDWRYGAYHFEEWLIDHDICSNIGSWHSCAGIGASTKVLIFDPISQAQQHDKDGAYVKLWLGNELKDRIAGIDQTHIHAKY